MANIAVEIDNSLPHAPLLHAEVHLKLGEKDKAWDTYLLVEVEQIGDVIDHYDEAIILVQDGQIWMAVKE